MAEGTAQVPKDSLFVQGLAVGITEGSWWADGESIEGFYFKLVPQGGDVTAFFPRVWVSPEKRKELGINEGEMFKGFVKVRARTSGPNAKRPGEAYVVMKVA